MSLEQETKLPSIPSLDAIQDPNVRAILAAMKEILEVREGQRPKGDDLDANVTFRDLYNVGLTSVNVGGQVVVNQSVDASLVIPVAGSGGTTTVNNTTIVTGGAAQDLTIPNTPGGLVATGTAMNVIVQWTHISNDNHSHIEVWRSDSNNLGLGVKIGTSDGDIYADAIGISNATRYYWIRAISKADIAGGYNAGASSGTSATTGKIGTGDLISVDGAKIIDATIVDAKIYSLAATKILSGRIAATQSVEVGTGANKVIIDGLGNVRMGATGYATGSGFWIGENAGLSKFYIGTPTEYIKYNGSNLEINTTGFQLTSGGNATFSGNLAAPTGTLGAVTIGTTGHIKGGQTAYNTGIGFFLGYETSAYKFSIGNPNGMFLRWTGNNLEYQGLSRIGGIAIYTTPGVYNTAGTYAQMLAGQAAFVVPIGVTTVYIAQLIAGGGGGGSTRIINATTAYYGTDGGGGEALQWVPITGLVAGQVIAVTVGAGGVGATVASGAGTAGGATSFGAYLTAAPGGGGPNYNRSVLTGPGFNNYGVGGRAGNDATATHGSGWLGTSAGAIGKAATKYTPSRNYTVLSSNGGSIEAGSNTLYRPVSSTDPSTGSTVEWPGQNAIGYGCGGFGGGSGSEMAGVINRGGNGSGGKVVIIW